ncbi:hypothetical protein [Shewanella glacialipiscicola]|uniref:hypothetical protein n=1 Tax=Shewanella glacialipiscicola TaxID=614069 RepID=UPI003D7A5E43
MNIEKEPDYWMVVGYSRMEGEYPVRFNLSKQQAEELASKTQGDRIEPQPHYFENH